MSALEEVSYKGNLLALIIRAHFESSGVQFLTPNDFSQQLAYMKHPKNYVIPPHTHNIITREVHFTREVLFIKRGKVRVDLYGECREYIESQILGQGDVILLAFGGHGFEMLEESEIIEVKQGPYTGETDKTRFEGVCGVNLKVKA
jgi:hypothetical protein